MTDIQHAHLYGMREAKYDWLSTHDINSTDWNEIEPQKPFHLFIPQNNDLFSEFQAYWKITELMPINSAGIVTARDSLAIHWSKEDAGKLIKRFLELSPDEARIEFQLGDDSRDWKIDLAQKDLRLNNFSQDKISKVLYRPFDIRYTFYTRNSRGFHCMPRGDVMRHMILRQNIGLISCRQQSQQGTWTLCGISNCIIESCAISNKTKEINSLFPLYIYPDTDSPKELQEQLRPNFSDEFLTEITNKLGYTPTPEAIFYYIYAIFHSPTYRTRYAEFLKIDFPRVPLTSDDQLFRKLGEYGEELVSLHLMKSSKLDQPLTQIIDKGGEFIVDAGHPKYSDGEVIINKKSDRFTGVPKSVWEFYVGGYQVCHKWLKDRKGRQLSPEDLNHYQKIIVALSETMQIMNAIDAAIPNFPIE